MPNDVLDCCFDASLDDAQAMELLHQTIAADPDFCRQPELLNKCILRIRSAPERAAGVAQVLVDSGALAFAGRRYGRSIVVDIVRQAHAADERHQEAVARILEAVLALGPAPIETDGWTAVHEACLGSAPIVLKALIAAGEPVDVADESGTTPLHVAFAFQLGECASCLRAAGADRDAKNNEERTPQQQLCRLLEAKSRSHAAELADAFAMKVEAAAAPAPARRHKPQGL